jgi:hypothetical protein
MIYIEAPNRPILRKIPSIFLAGGITDCPDHQSETIKNIESLDIVIFNPRRKNFPIKNPNAAYEQIKWEHDMLRATTIISMWLCKETLGPICLYELGAWSMTQKPLIVGMDPEYQRRQDVEIQTKLVRPDVPIVYSLKDLSNAIFEMYNKVSLYV